MISEQSYQQHLQALIEQGSYAQSLPPLILKEVAPKPSWLQKLLESLFKHLPHFENSSLPFSSLNIQLLKWILIVVLGSLALILIYLFVRYLRTKFSKQKKIIQKKNSDQSSPVSSWLHLIREALSRHQYSEASRLCWKYFLD